MSPDTRAAHARGDLCKLRAAIEPVPAANASPRDSLTIDSCSTTSAGSDPPDLIASIIVFAMPGFMPKRVWFTGAFLNSPVGVSALYHTAHEEPLRFSGWTSATTVRRLSEKRRVAASDTVGRTSSGLRLGGRFPDQHVFATLQSTQRIRVRGDAYVGVMSRNARRKTTDARCRLLRLQAPRPST